MTEPSFKLRAIVAVDPAHRVRCQQPSCGHSVYARIHVVEEEGQLLVLGSDCFARRYGEGHTTSIGGAGSGSVLTAEERELLLSNTSAFLAEFEAECLRRQELAEEKLKALRQAFMDRQHRFVAPPIQRVEPLSQPQTTEEPPATKAFPLPAWASLKKPNSAFFAYGMGAGQCWVLMQSVIHSGCFIAPAPTPFEGWDEALPSSLGQVDPERQVYKSEKFINDLVDWFASRCTNGSRIDSDAVAIKKFALGLRMPGGE